jgi:hypothetical protein
MLPLVIYHSNSLSLCSLVLLEISEIAQEVKQTIERQQLQLHPLSPGLTPSPRPCPTKSNASLEEELTWAQAPAFPIAPTWHFPPRDSSLEVISPPNASSTPSSTADVSHENSSHATVAPTNSIQAQRQSESQQPVVTDLTDDEDFADEDDFSAWIVQQEGDEIRRLSKVSTGSQRALRRRSSTILPRNLPITAPFASLDSYTYNGIRLAPNVFVELGEGNFDRDFMKIVHIVKDRRTSEVTLRGYIFRRTREMNGVLEKKLNEVCWIIHVDDDDARDSKAQGVETIPVTEVIKRRRIRLTNQSFPALSFREDGLDDPQEEVENGRVLVCRYKYLCFYPNAKARIANAWCEKGFHRLRRDECDKYTDNYMQDEELRSLWRGTTIPGGAREGWLRGEKEFLRQEGRSHEGLKGNQSLRSSFGPDFPEGEPMDRGSVGRVLHLRDLGAGIIASCDDHNVHTVPDAIAIDDGEEEVDSPPSAPRSQQRRRVHHKHLTPSAGLANWLDSSDDDSDDAGVLFGLSRGVRPSSSTSHRPRQNSPRVVEIDAQVKTSSSSGIVQKRYEGRITSTYTPSPLSQTKRPAERSGESPERPVKRMDLGRRADPGHRGLYQGGGTSSRLGGRLYTSRESSPYDSDINLGHSQAEDADDVVDLSMPERVRGFKTKPAGLLTPVSLVKPKPIRCRPVAPSWTPVNTARCCTPFPTHDQRNKDEDTVVDLTKPRPRTYSANVDDRNPHRSIAPQYDPSASLERQQTQVSNHYKTSPSPHVAPCSTSTKANGYSFLQLNPTSEGLRSRPGFRPTHRVSTPNASARLPRPGSAWLSSQLSFPSSRIGSQVQVTSEDASNSVAKQRRYTFGDAFCGAGGMSRSAINAGLRIEWGFDFSLPACQNYALNFFGTPIYNVWANEFAEGPGDHKIDICHLSPPCQFFSDAHTIMGKDDEMNTASLFAIFNLLEKAKPRIVTLEQTSGLIRRHPIYFNTVINMFTSRGFSVRWRVMNCADFGLPQRRMRLFVIASW